jgi:hypothetical protein
LALSLASIGEISKRGEPRCGSPLFARVKSTASLFFVRILFVRGLFAEETTFTLNLVYKHLQGMLSGGHNTGPVDDETLAVPRYADGVEGTILVFKQFYVIDVVWCDIFVLFFPT